MLLLLPAETEEEHAEAQMMTRDQTEMSLMSAPIDCDFRNPDDPTQIQRGSRLKDSD